MEIENQNYNNNDNDDRKVLDMEMVYRLMDLAGIEMKDGYDTDEDEDGDDDDDFNMFERNIFECHNNNKNMWSFDNNENYHRFDVNDLKVYFDSLKFEDKEVPEDETVLDNGEIIPFNPFRSIFVDDD